MNAATEVKRHKLTQEDCDTVRLLLARRRTLKEIAEIISVDPSTVGKIRLANYDLQTYLEQRKQMNRKTKERKAAEEAGRRRLNALLDPVADEERDQKILDQLIREEQAAGRYPMLAPVVKGERDEWVKEQLNALDTMARSEREAEVQGQMKMDLDQQAEEPELRENSKLMKFQAAMVDKVIKALTEMIVTLDNRLTALDEIRDAMKRGKQ